MTVAVCNLSLVLFFSILFLPSSFSTFVALDPPQHSPSPSPSPLSLLEENSLPSLPSGEYLSPPAPSSPTPSLLNSASPAPATEKDADADNENKISNTLNSNELSSRGMSSGQKAGVALGVIAGACVVAVGGVIYKKRHNNIRRSRFGYPSRVERI